MALWGNNDAVGSNGTVTLNYSAGVVTGSGTTFGQVGAAKTGDVIKFGIKGTAASATYFGDAVIVAIAGTQSLTIGSTAGLSGAAIAATSFQVSECPCLLLLMQITVSVKKVLSLYMVLPLLALMQHRTWYINSHMQDG